MNIADCKRYYIPAVNRIMGVDVTHLPTEYEVADAFAKFDELIGEAGLYERFHCRPTAMDFPIRADLRAVLEKLAGPNGKTLLKIYRIQKGLEGNED